MIMRACGMQGEPKIIGVSMAFSCEINGTTYGFFCYPEPDMD